MITLNHDIRSNNLHLIISWINVVITRNGNHSGL